MSQDYDVALKQLLRTSTRVLWQQLTGAPVAEWLNVESPKVENRRVDLLARLIDGRHFHIELQSRNEPNFARRMAEYHLSLERIVGKPVHPIGLYVGKAPLSMEATYRSECLQFSFPLIDFRDLDGAPLIASPDLGDNMLAILTELDKERVIASVLNRIALLSPDQQRVAGMEFVILSVLRGVDQHVREWVQRMPLVIDFNDSEVFGPSYRKGREEGRIETERETLRLLLNKRFGLISPSVNERIDTGTGPELKRWIVRILDAPTLEAVFE